MCTGCAHKTCGRKRRSEPYQFMDPVRVEIEKMLFVQDDYSIVPLEEKIIEEVEIENGPLIAIDESDIYELDQTLKPV